MMEVFLICWIGMSSFHIVVCMQFGKMFLYIFLLWSLRRNAEIENLNRF
jgi:hypothetical protein